MTATMTNTVVNGIDTTALQGAIAAISADAAAGQTRWTVSSRWVGGTRSDHRVESCQIGGQDILRQFILSTDEPTQLCGTNKFANPQEYLLSSMNACMMVGYTAVAALMGVKLTKLEVQTTGDIDLRGFLGLDPTVPAGYPRLQQTVHPAGDGTPDPLQKLPRTGKNTGPTGEKFFHSKNVDACF